MNEHHTLIEMISCNRSDRTIQTSYIYRESHSLVWVLTCFRMQIWNFTIVSTCLRIITYFLINSWFFFLFLFFLVHVKVAIRWFYQQRVSVIVKSFNKERMEQNLDIFDWELSGEELQKIEQILQYRGSRAEAYLSENGPFRTVEEIWDGEI